MRQHRMIVCLALSLVLGGAGSAHAYTTVQQINQTVDAQNFVFTFSNVPLSSTTVTVYVDLYGDYDATTEYGDVWIDNVAQATQAQGSATQCNAAPDNGRTTYTVPASSVADRTLVVRVQASASVNYAICANYAPRVRVTLVYTALPDLTVTASTVPVAGGSVAGAGSQFQITYTVTNLYENFTTDFWVDFFYCSAANTTTCTSLGFSYITDDFAAGQSRTYTSGTLTMPDNVQVGTRYIRIGADVFGGGNVTETNETNNNRFHAITVSTLPDLSFSATTVPFTGNTTNPGTSTFTGQYTIANAADSSAVYTDFVVHYYYCPTATAAGCVSLGTQTITQDIMSGASYTFTSITLTLPATATSGIRYIRTVIDSTTLVAESNETNNEDYDAIIVGTGVAPDMTADNLTVPYTGTTTSAGATFTVRSRLVNLTTAAFTNDFTVQYYYCLTQAATFCTALLAVPQSITNDFAGNGTLFVNSPTLTIPTAATYGNAYIRIFVDSGNAVPEANEVNNNVYASITITGKPDLTIAAVTVPFTGTTGGPGDTFNGRFTITNKAATSSFTTDFDVEYFYCPNANTTGCVSLGKEKITANFLSGTTYTYNSMSLTMPGSATLGTHYIRAFVDAGAPGVIDEADETNNNVYAPITVTKASPDFYVKTFTAAVAGQQVTYTVEVCNQGGATTTSFSIGLVYNGASAPTCATAADQTFTVTGGLAAAGCVTHAFNQPSAPVGTTTAWAMADQACAVGEALETNNTKSATVTVTSPDLAVKKDTGIEPDYSIKPPDFKVTSDLQAVDQTPPQPDQFKPQPDQSVPQADKSAPQPDKSVPVTDGPQPQQDQAPPTGDKGAVKLDKGTTPPKADGGCSCEVPAHQGGEPLWLGLLLGAFVLVLRRRR